MSPEQEIAQAAAKLREQPNRPMDRPLADWLESWSGVPFTESGPLPDDLQHALAIARAVNGDRP
ncbi:hypothetical protein [Nonomuraea sp. NPDC023979]|uniref:hypothetical protein n=1 Tax=Nonomuraea sp. NPDC023979 TaxID=3154796 RepID=UPI0033C9A958